MPSTIPIERTVTAVAPVPTQSRVTVIGGGIAGVEASLQLASRGVEVTLIEMRPTVMGPAHHTDRLAELVCSNSLKSDDPVTAAGELKRELELMGSFVMRVARASSVPAGGALAVDRDAFSRALTEMIQTHPRVHVVRDEARSLPEGPVVIATGPLTSAGLEPVLSDLVGAERLSFFDAAAPIVEAQSIDRSVIFTASRYGKGEGADYLNAPLSRSEYERFVAELTAARRVLAKDFERRELFAACQPIEEVARTGPDAIRFGALKPVGLSDPRTGERPWAVVQLRAENREATAYNLVGFQTNLTWPEQERVFRLIPGLAQAEFSRFGVMHRNTFIDSPRLLDETLALRSRPRVRFAGQITGTEGYLEAAASGLLAGINTYADVCGLRPFTLPVASVFGALVAYSTDPRTKPYQPLHVNYGIISPLEQRVRGKQERYFAYAERALSALLSATRERPDLFERG